MDDITKLLLLGKGQSADKVEPRFKDVTDVLGGVLKNFDSGDFTSDVRKLLPYASDKQIDKNAGIYLEDYLIGQLASGMGIGPGELIPIIKASQQFSAPYEQMLKQMEATVMI